MSSASRLVWQQAFSLLDSESFAQVSEYMRKVEFDKASFEWSYYGNLHAKFKLNLRHLFSNLDFAGLVEDAPLQNPARNRRMINRQLAFRHHLFEEQIENLTGGLEIPARPHRGLCVIVRGAHPMLPVSGGGIGVGRRICETEQ